MHGFKSKMLSEVRAQRNRASRAQRAGLLTEDQFLQIKNYCDRLEEIYLLLEGD